MRINSKILGIFLAVFCAAVVISAAGAADLSNNFGNDNFAVKVPPQTNFNDVVNVSVNGMNMVIFENSGNNSNDINSIMYFKDSSADKNEITSFINDLEKNGNKVEENDKYIVLKNTHDLKDVDIENNIDGFFNFMDDFFSSKVDLNVSADGNSVSFSGDGLNVSDANGEGVSISSNGVSVSSNASSGNESVDVSSDIDSNIKDCDYSLYLKNNDDKVIVISGNNLDLLKAMAETVSFNEI